jgi:PAS domain S-box-containing protein
MAKILVVDDWRPNRELLRTILGDKGYQILEAHDGSEAIGVAKAERPDLVISDILMPTMDGYEFVRQLRAHAATANTPVIFSTAHYLDREATALAKACGVEVTIFKPLDPARVIQAVEDALGATPQSESLPEPSRFDRAHLQLLTDKLSEKTEHLRRTNERLAALVELGYQVAGEHDTIHMLENFCRAARTIVGAKYSAVAVLDEDGKTLRHFLTSGMEPAFAAQIGSIPSGRGVLSYNLRNGGTLRVHDISRHPQSEGFPPNHPKMTSFLGAAISSSSGIYGSLYLTDKIGFDEFSEDDERLVAMLGAQVGTAYENSKQFAEIQQRAVDLEKSARERQQAEEALREANQTLESLVQTSPLAIIAIDLEGKVKSWNSAAERIFGWTESEVSGQSYAMVTDHRPEEVDSFIKSALEGQTIPALETRRKRRDGSSIDVSISSAALRDGQGKVNGVMAVIADIAGRKNLEEQFLQSQKMEAVGRLAGGIAHDFNNLLTAIIGYSQMALLRLPSEDPLRKDIQEIETAGQRAASLTSQLLAFSRRQVIQPKVLDLNTVVADLSNMLQRLIGEDIELHNSLDSEIGFVKADRGQIEQIVMNLAVNARDAMPEGGKLTIETRGVELDENYASEHLDVCSGPHVMLAITDTGTGMDKETESRIFEPFFTTKEQGKGTGLGLSTVYGIVKQSGGHIGVHSEPGRGTTFKLYLPQVDEDEGRPIEDPTEMPANGTETVLLVEDESQVRKFAALVLRGTGYKVLEASGGEEALISAQQHKGRIHMLLTDVVMPGMSGKELSERLKQRRPNIKVIFASGYTDDAILHHGVLGPEMEFIQKPFTPSSLTQKVRQVLGKAERVSGQKV